MPVHESEKYLRKCLQSLLAQTFRDFEIIIIEDPPFDRTKEIVVSFKDRRIKYSRNEKRLGRYKTRNKCVQNAMGDYVFFTDDDCTFSKDWIAEGLKFFMNTGSIAVEGRTYYVSETYKPTFSDHVVENREKGHFMTCNMAYRKSFIQSVGGFDERYERLGDRDLGLRAVKLGRVDFNPKMIVFHQKVTLTPKEFVRKGREIRNRVFLYKKFGERALFRRRIVSPLSFLAIAFPPLILASLFGDRFKTREDYILLPYVYIRLIYERLNLWDICAREKVFLI